MKTAGVFTLLAVAANIAAVAVGVSYGIQPPPTVDFGNAEQLSALAQEPRPAILAYWLGLLSPCLALPIGFGWLVLLRRSAHAQFGVLMFYVGMLFVVLLDILELALYSELPTRYVAATDAAKPAILALGGVLDLTKAVLGYVGHFFAFGLAQFAIGLAILKDRVVPSWLGWLSLVPAILLGWLATALTLSGRSSAAGGVAAIGVPIFFVWLLSMGVVLLRAAKLESTSTRRSVVFS
jgi:hypothetical protein